jgi:hypothetical protein
MFYEADACARAIREGRLEAERCPLEESLLVMEVMDEVRRQNGFRYPESLERVEV